MELELVQPVRPSSEVPARVETNRRAPLLVAIDMGYGHLRPAASLAEVLDVRVTQADMPPVAGPEEEKLWKSVRSFYGFASRVSQLGMWGAPLRHILDSLTAIPHLHPYRDLSAPTLPVSLLRRLAHRGLGRDLVEVLYRSGCPLLTTFYAPAVLADHHGYPSIYCVVTDVDVNRVWAPFRPERSHIVYLVPGERTRRRLLSYGVRPERIHVTGFPLPHSLLGGSELPALRENLAARLLRLDPKGVFRDQCAREVELFLGKGPRGSDVGGPPHLTFAVGGTGAQVGLARQFLPSLRGVLSARQLRLSLVAGVRRDVAEAFKEALRDTKLEHCLGDTVHILCEPDFAAYIERFNALLAHTDVLWTKPSEMSFYAALGLPLILAWPLGAHERYNRRWIIENGAGIKQRDPRFVAEWLTEMLCDGTLAHAAWSGFMRLPKFGLYRIAEIVAGAGVAPALSNR